MEGVARRGAGLGALAAAALLCVGSAANRLGAADPLAPPRPGTAWFGYAADRHDVMQALGEQRGADAAAAARRLVSAAPVERLSTSLLGSTLLATGDAAAADAAFRVAGQLGWRDPVTQLYWLGIAMAVPDHAVAMQRADALLRAQAPPAAWDALRMLEAQPASRALIVGRLALSPGWAPAYAGQLRTLDPAAAARRVGLILAASRAGLKLDRNDATGAVRGLVDARQAGLAQAFWTGLMGAGDLRQSGLWQRSFADLQSGSGKSPFEWRPITTAPVELSIGGAPAGGPEPALFARAFGNLPEAVAVQTVRLAPGRYAATWRAGGGETLDLTVDCAGKPLAPEPVPASGDARLALHGARGLRHAAGPHHGPSPRHAARCGVDDPAAPHPPALAALRRSRDRAARRRSHPSRPPPRYPAAGAPHIRRRRCPSART